MTAAYFLLGAVALAASILVVVSRRTIQSALWLVVSFLALAGIYLMLGAELVAAVQVIVYAGSVIVLFVFVIMTVGYREEPVLRSSAGWLAAGIFLGTTVMVELLTALRRLGKGAGARGDALPTASLNQELARLLFSEWLVPLEVFSLLIVAVMVGMAALRREGRRP